MERGECKSKTCNTETDMCVCVCGSNLPSLTVVFSLASSRVVVMVASATRTWSFGTTLDLWRAEFELCKLVSFRTIPFVLCPCSILARKTSALSA